MQSERSGSVRILEHPCGSSPLEAELLDESGGGVGAGAGAGGEVGGGGDADQDELAVRVLAESVLLDASCRAECLKT